MYFEVNNLLEDNSKSKIENLEKNLKSIKPMELKIYLLQIWYTQQE